MSEKLTAKDMQVIAQPLAAQLGFDIVDIELRKSEKQWVVVVIVDGDEAIDLDALPELSDVISQGFDRVGLLGDQPYTLEVTTPGVDRPLTHLRQWKRHRGRLVKATFATGELVGRIGPLVKLDDNTSDNAADDLAHNATDNTAGSGEHSVVLVVAPPRAKGQPVSKNSLKPYIVKLSDMLSAVVQIEFKPPHGADFDMALDDDLGRRAQCFSPVALAMKENK